MPYLIDNGGRRTGCAVPSAELSTAEIDRLVCCVSNGGLAAEQSVRPAAPHWRLDLRILLALGRVTTTFSNRPARRGGFPGSFGGRKGAEMGSAVLPSGRRVFAALILSIAADAPSPLLSPPTTNRTPWCCTTITL